MCLNAAAALVLADAAPDLTAGARMAGEALDRGAVRRLLADWIALMIALPDVLRNILAHKADEVAAGRRARSFADLAAEARTREPPRGFTAALRATVTAGRTALIAEVKRASPSKGVIRADWHPVQHARAYAVGGATCLSVLTDERFFGGSADTLVDVRQGVTLPVLRKDFTIDPWQVAEAAALGADAVLLIVAALDDARLAELHAAAAEHGLDVLVEVHDETEMARAARLQPALIGVNNRDLRSFVTDLAVTERLAALAPPGALLVTESGIGSPADLARLARSGVRAALVGESLMRSHDIRAATEALLA